MDMAQIALRQIETPDASLASLIAGERGTDVPARQDATVTFALVETEAAFEALAAEWNQLFQRAARPEHVFQTFAWSWHWCRHYLPKGRRKGPRLAIVTGRIDGRLELLLPLVVVTKAGLRQLAWMGEPVSQYGDIVASPEAIAAGALAPAWAFAVSATRADVAHLRKVRADSIAAPLLASLGSRITAREEAPFIDLSRHKTFAAYEEGISSKGRKNRRRMLRRISEQGSVSFETLSDTEEAGQLTAYAILLKRGWLKQRNQISLAMADHRYTTFFANAAAGGAHPTGCKVALIRSRNETAALQVMLEHKGARFLHISVFASKFEKVGPGGLLLEHTVVDCFKDGMTTFDFLAPKHEYKLEFAHGTVSVDDHALALTALGRAYMATCLGARSRLKAAVEAMPAPLKRGLMSAVALVKKRS